MNLSLSLSLWRKTARRHAGKCKVRTFESVYFTCFIRYCTWKYVGKNGYVSHVIFYLHCRFNICLSFLIRRFSCISHRFMKDVDKFNETTVSAFVTAGGVVFLLLHKKKNYSQYRIFFEKVHELFVKVSSFSFPFFFSTASFSLIYIPHSDNYESFLRTLYSNYVQEFRSTCQGVCKTISYLDFYELISIYIMLIYIS